jgi:hypothetical protein
MNRAPWLALLLLVPLACSSPEGDDDSGTDDDDSGVTDDDDDDDGPVWDGCRAERQAADRDRLVVVSLPYGAGAEQASTWAAMTLTADGALLDDGARFEMGRAMGGEVVFTPDGQVGLVAQEDGSVGVFLASTDGTLEVVHEAFSGDFYASSVVVEPSGERAWIVDGNWVENGGGIYEVAIDCDDGTLGAPQLVVEAKLAGGLLLDPTVMDRAVLVAHEVPGAEVGDDAVMLAWGGEPAALGGADAFGDDEAWVSAAAVTPDGAYVLLGDNSMFNQQPNRVAVVGVEGDTLVAVQVLDNVEDPMDIVPSPFHDAALVVSGYGDALFVLDLDPVDPEPYAYAGEMDYRGARPALPASASLVTRGDLRGLVLVTENQGVRAVQFHGGGEVEDLGMAVEGDGYEAITGALGIQP